MADITKFLDYLKNYDGEEVRIMEVCGSHTAAIAKSGIKGIVSDKIKFLSGPGCPVCVTPSAYIDRLIELSHEENVAVVTFGDLLRVPGSKSTLMLEKGKGADVIMVYSPLETITLAEENPEKTFVFAAVGFETTTPTYALLLDKIVKNNIKNIKLLTALKTMPEIIGTLVEGGAKIDGFIAPGHVSVITGGYTFKKLSEKYDMAFAVMGFGMEELVLGIYGLVRMINERKTLYANFYPSVVTEEGNVLSKNIVDKYFEKADAVWRGMGNVENSGLSIRDEFAFYDAGSNDLTEDIKINKACHCDQVLMGKIQACDCPLFAKVCNPQTPQGACMVSSEGSCYQNYINR
ncbi:MAG: hydrogenase formation protein HypD [Lachnospiraceae bacterium]|nr:hydrogenase formation protein HypD [Lachnospiraceae bacterium]